MRILELWTILPQPAIECLRRSSQQGVGQFWTKCGEEGLTDVSQILTRTGRDMRLSYAKEILSISSAVWAQCMNVTDRQTDRPRNGNIGTNRRNCFSTMSPNNVAYLYVIYQHHCFLVVCFIAHRPTSSARFVTEMTHYTLSWTLNPLCQTPLCSLPSRTSIIVALHLH